MKKLAAIVISIFFIPVIIFSQKVNKSSAVQASLPEM